MNFVNNFRVRDKFLGKISQADEGSWKIEVLHISEENRVHFHLIPHVRVEIFSHFRFLFSFILQAHTFVKSFKIRGLELSSCAFLPYCSYCITFACTFHWVNSNYARAWTSVINSHCRNAKKFINFAFKQFLMPIFFLTAPPKQLNWGKFHSKGSKSEKNQLHLCHATMDSSSYSSSS